MTDQLDQLTDAQLSEVFAREVAAWGIHSRNTAFWVDAEKRDGTAFDVRALVGELRFATSADAVLPFLERQRAWSKGTVGQAVTVYGERLSPSPKPEGVPDSEWMILAPIGHHWNEAKPLVSFARAACIALIRAKRAEKGGGK